MEGTDNLAFSSSPCASTGMNAHSVWLERLQQVAHQGQPDRHERSHLRGAARAFRGRDPVPWRVPGCPQYFTDDAEVRPQVRLRRHAIQGWINAAQFVAGLKAIGTQRDPEPTDRRNQQGDRLHRGGLDTAGQLATSHTRHSPLLRGVRRGRERQDLSGVRPGNSVFICLGANSDEQIANPPDTRAADPGAEAGLVSTFVNYAIPGIPRAVSTRSWPWAWCSRSGPPGCSTSRSARRRSCRRSPSTCSTSTARTGTVDLLRRRGARRRPAHRVWPSTGSSSGTSRRRRRRSSSSSSLGLLIAIPQTIPIIFGATPAQQRRLSLAQPADRLLPLCGTRSTAGRSPPRSSLVGRGRAGGRLQVDAVGLQMRAVVGVEAALPSSKA